MLAGADPGGVLARWRRAPESTAAVPRGRAPARRRGPRDRAAVHAGDGRAGGLPVPTGRRTARVGGRADPRTPAGGAAARSIHPRQPRALRPPGHHGDAAAHGAGGRRMVAGPRAARPVRVRVGRRRRTARDPHRAGRDLRRRRRGRVRSGSRRRRSRSTAPDWSTSCGRRRTSPASPVRSIRHRSRPPSGSGSPKRVAAAPLPDWWSGSGAPLVYVTFGTVLGFMTLAADVYRTALRAVEAVDARVLLTVGSQVRTQPT